MRQFYKLIQILVMRIVNILLISMVLPLSVQSQVPWNDPPEYITYSGRTIEVILPPPQNFIASNINNNQVLLKWDDYWTNIFFIQYKNRIGYPPIPNRFSLYKQNLTDGDGITQALSGVTWDENQYIDTDVINGKKYMYQIIASDQNYLTQGGWQRWSKRDDAKAIIIVGELGVKELEYWEEVEEYENDRKVGWFGCSAKY